MSFWVSVWTPPSFAFSWAALNLASAVVGGWTKAFGLRGGCGFTAVFDRFWRLPDCLGRVRCCRLCVGRLVGAGTSSQPEAEGQDNECKDDAHT